MAGHRLDPPAFDTVHSALQTWTAEDLKRLLKQLQTPERPTRKADLVAIR